LALDPAVDPDFQCKTIGAHMKGSDQFGLKTVCIAGEPGLVSLDQTSPLWFSDKILAGQCKLVVEMKESFADDGCCTSPGKSIIRRPRVRLPFFSMAIRKVTFRE
jgi:hypothetical protein